MYGERKRTMSGKATYKQKDIVLTKFPFSNLMDYKVRPVLVLSKDSYNRKYADVIVCAITSNLEESDYGLTITTESLDEGHLKMASKVRAGPRKSIEQAINRNKIGNVKQGGVNNVLSKLN